MTRKVFFSFHYSEDSWRASTVRNIGVVDGNKPASDNDWETVIGGGDSAIKKWIDSQLDGRTCTVVLIGNKTANRKWVEYEIKKSWESKKGVVGIYIHNLKDSSSNQTEKGKNPFAKIKVKTANTSSNTETSLSYIVKDYDPPYSTSTNVYNHISANLSAWIEEAIKIRNENI